MVIINVDIDIMIINYCYICMILLVEQLCI